MSKAAAASETADIPLDKIGNSSDYLDVREQMDDGSDAAGTGYEQFSGKYFKMILILIILFLFVSSSFVNENILSKFPGALINNQSTNYGDTVKVGMFVIGYGLADTAVRYNCL